MHRMNEKRVVKCAENIPQKWVFDLHLAARGTGVQSPQYTIGATLSQTKPGKFSKAILSQANKRSPVLIVANAPVEGGSHRVSTV